MNSLRVIEHTELMESEEAFDQFYEDVITGLQSPKKHLFPKYFYDEQGDILFQKIMNCKDYYLTRAEMNIFQYSSSLLADGIQAKEFPFDLIELGAGDATKTFYLLQHLVEANADFKYIPIDISTYILDVTERNLYQSLPKLEVVPIQGDYFQALPKACEFSSNKKVLMFLGSNIGNLSPKEAIKFCKQLSMMLNSGDKLIIGFDLKKNPAMVLKAYNDSEGITSKFNLNLLHRINRELKGNFNVEKFEHYQTYDPETGACKSYLVSLCEQMVDIGTTTISFEENETIYMEVSQKYDLKEIAAIATQSGFRSILNCFDKNRHFVDAIWEVA